jgi:hypothetical protein
MFRGLIVGAIGSVLAIKPMAEPRDAKLRRVGDMKCRLPRMSATAMSALITEIKQTGAPDLASRRHIRAARDATTKTTTPYGELHQFVDVVRTDGSTAALEIADPFATWSHIMKHDCGFASFVEHRMRDARPDPHTPWSLILYSDEVVPGNPLDGDNLRKVQAVYYSFKELGMRALMREESWFVICIVRSAIVSKLADGMSQVMRAIVRHLFCDGGSRNFQVCGLPLDFHSGTHIRMFARLSIFVQDERAHKETFENKGASGVRPCMICRNVVSNKSELSLHSPSGRITTISESNVAKFVLHTDASIRACVYKMEEIYNTSNKTTLDMYEQAYGFNYKPHGLLLDRTLEEYVQPFSTFMSDWMHVFVVSGIFNYHMRNLLVALRGLKPMFNVHTLGDYVDAWCMPAKFGRNSLKGVCGPKHIKNALESDAETFKCSASEAVGLYPIISFLLKCGFLPAEVLVDHVLCFLRLADILDMISSAPRCVVSPEQLEQACSDHIASYSVLYGEKKVKPKFHASMHFGHFLRLHGMLVSCWTHERRHKRLKRAANDIYNTKTFEHSVLSDSTVQHIHDITKAGEYNFGVGLVSPRPAPKKLSSLMKTAWGADVEFSIGAAVRISCWDTVHVGDVVLVRNDDGLRAGKVIANVCTGDALVCVVSVWTLASMCYAHATWVVNDNPQIIRVEDIIDATTWRDEGTTVTTLLPPICRKHSQKTNAKLHALYLYINNYIYIHTYMYITRM